MHRRMIRYRKALTVREAAWSGLWFLTWAELGCQCSARVTVPGSLSSIRSVFGTGAKGAFTDIIDVELVVPRVVLEVYYKRCPVLAESPYFKMGWFKIVVSIAFCWKSSFSYWTNIFCQVLSVGLLQCGLCTSHPNAEKIIRSEHFALQHGQFISCCTIPLPVSRLHKGAGWRWWKWTWFILVSFLQEFQHYYQQFLLAGRLSSFLPFEEFWIIEEQRIFCWERLEFPAVLLLGVV